MKPYYYIEEKIGHRWVRVPGKWSCGKGGLVQARLSALRSSSMLQREQRVRHSQTGEIQ